MTEEPTIIEQFLGLKSQVNLSCGHKVLVDSETLAFPTAERVLLIRCRQHDDYNFNEPFDQSLVGISWYHITGIEEVDASVPDVYSGIPLLMPFDYLFLPNEPASVSDSVTESDGTESERRVTGLVTGPSPEQKQ